MESRNFQFAVIGGGIVGISVARALALAKYRVVLVERRADVLSGASGANSGILHCGFDSEPGLLETRLVLEGHVLMRALLKAFSLDESPLVAKTGAILTADTVSEVQALQSLHERTRNTHHTLILSPDECLARVPALKRPPLLGMFVPEEWVADSWMIGAFLLGQALESGLVLLTNMNVQSCEYKNGAWHLNDGAKGSVMAQQVINCTGTHADIVEALAWRRPAPFVSQPRLGQFAIFETPAPPSNPPVPVILYPMPTPKTKGVLLYPSLAGVLVAGPTAEDQQSREDIRMTENARNTLVQSAKSRLNLEWKDVKLQLEYAGLRPATDVRDYVIVGDKTWICVASIRSTGFTACLSIAQHVCTLLGVPSQFRTGNFPQGFDLSPKMVDGQIIVCGRSMHVSHPLTKLRLLKTSKHDHSKL